MLRDLLTTLPQRMCRGAHDRGVNYLHHNRCRMSKGKSPMTKEAAARIQSEADQTGTNQGFKVRAQSAAEKNEK